MRFSEQRVSQERLRGRRSSGESLQVIYVSQDKELSMTF